MSLRWLRWGEDPNNTLKTPFHYPYNTLTMHFTTTLQYLYSTFYNTLTIPLQFYNTLARPSQYPYNTHTIPLQYPYNIRCHFSGALSASEASSVVFEGDSLFDSNFAAVDGGEKTS